MRKYKIPRLDFQQLFFVSGGRFNIYGYHFLQGTSPIPNLRINVLQRVDVNFLNSYSDTKVILQAISLLLTFLGYNIKYRLYTCSVSIRGSSFIAY